MGKEEETNGDVRLEGPLGFSLSATGKDVRLMFFITVLFAFGCSGLYFHDKHITDILSDYHSTAAESRARTEAEIKNENDALQGMIYVLSLPEKERWKLHINMPDSLRKQLHGQSQEDQ